MSESSERFRANYKKIVLKYAQMIRFRGPLTAPQLEQNRIDFLNRITLAEQEEHNGILVWWPAFLGIQEEPIMIHELLVAQTRGEREIL